MSNEGYSGDLISSGDSTGIPSVDWDEETNNTGLSLTDRDRVKTVYPSRIECRSYKCPNCTGEFNSWDTLYDDGDDLLREDEIVGSVRRPKFTEVDVCPFCRLQKGEYENEN